MTEARYRSADTPRGTSVTALTVRSMASLRTGGCGEGDDRAAARLVLILGVLAPREDMPVECPGADDLPVLTLLLVCLMLDGGLAHRIVGRARSGWDDGILSW